MLPFLLAQTRPTNQQPGWYVAIVMLVGLLAILWMGLKGTREPRKGPPRPPPPTGRDLKPRNPPKGSAKDNPRDND